MAVVNGLDAITQNAHETLERHWEDPDSASESGMHGTLCGECENEWPCPDRVAVERIVHAATTLAATEVERASLVAWMERRMTLIPEYEARLHKQANTIRELAATHEKIRAHAKFIAEQAWPSPSRERAGVILGLLEPSEHTHEETT